MSTGRRVTSILACTEGRSSTRQRRWRAIIATFHDPTGKVAVAGFYDAVRDWPDNVRAGMRALPFDEKKLLAEVGAPALGGEPGYTVLERLWTRPDVRDQRAIERLHR